MANMQGAPTSGQQEEQKTALEQYGINLTEIAKSGKLDPVIGRDAEIRRILELENQVSALTGRVRELERALADEMLNRPGRRVFAAGAEGDVIPLRAGTRTKKSTSVVVWRPFGPRD